MFKKSKLQKALNKIKKDRDKYFSGELDNIVFLDFDGVLNIDPENPSSIYKLSKPMINLNNFCLENNFKIVVISSWRKTSNYKEILYKSGLNPNIKILGATQVFEKDRESEVIDYLENHTNINKFIILDDGRFNELSLFQIRTDYNDGFDDLKYNESIILINNIDWKKYK